MTLHEDDRETFVVCKEIAFMTAKRFKLKLKVFEPKCRPQVCMSYGLCYCEEHRISVVFRFRIKTQVGQVWFDMPDQLSNILNTVGHELAHLRHPDHSKRFWTLANKIIKYILETYYDPCTLDFKLASVN